MCYVFVKYDEKLSLAKKRCLPGWGNPVLCGTGKNYAGHKNLIIILNFNLYIPRKYAII